jgi:SpoVK/Ycf46/Vps4 family AAA+-type ATPase
VHLRGEVLEDIDLAQLARRANNYSGSDLKNLAVSAALESLKDVLSETWTIQKKLSSEGPSVTDSNEGKDGAHRVGMQDSEEEDCHLASFGQPISMQHSNKLRRRVHKIWHRFRSSAAGLRNFRRAVRLRRIRGTVPLHPIWGMAQLHPIGATVRLRPTWGIVRLRPIRATVQLRPI